ncbi:MAG: hypothetical protein M1828_004659 [Chrysothrix sp. TS-e1954]|nr:MAG: hypothetical protein M1828_004659 [Chrysothrix sp. TS-e1954]
MEDLHKMRSGLSLNGSANAGNKPTPIGKPPMYGSTPNGNAFPKNQQNPMYFPQSTLNRYPGNNDGNIDVLTRGLSGMSLQSPAYAQSTRPSSQMSTHSSVPGGVSLGNGMPYMANGQIMWTGANFPTQGVHNYGNAVSPTTGLFNPVGAQYVNQGTFAPYPPNFMDHSPNWTASRTSSGEMPSLVTPRRDSSSSNEHDIPGTPFTSFTSYGHGVPIIDRSPQSICAWSTPSPTQTGYPTGKPYTPSNVSLHLQLLCQQDPPIPSAIPAPFSPMKPLDRALENPHGATNVYIRGLLPNTTDDMLYALAARFGDIISSKSIIDHTTSECKGYGFVKFHNFKDAESCIRGFHYCGYETSFARESFYNQLKKLSDEENTNLYVSNLPKDMNEHELGATFGIYKVCSSRILRNSDGTGRGVGFARFESRDVCENVIKEYNNMPVAKTEGEEHLIQIRFADTPEQKALKQQTTAARQYRTAEYESQTHGGSFPGSRLNSMSSSGQMAGAGFESYMNMNGNYPQVPQHPIVGLAGRFAARDRLNNFSSHLQVSQRAGVKPETETETVPADAALPRISTADDKETDELVKSENLIS